jgi:hypothetical protein
MADAAERLLEEYRARFLAGEGPDVHDYLERAGVDADRLADLLDAFLQQAPAPDPDQEAIATVHAIAAGEPALLTQRTARGIRRAGVIDAIMERFGILKRHRARVEERYHQLETGLIDARRVDEGVVAAIASAFGVRPSELVFGKPPRFEARAYLRMAPPPPWATPDAPAPRPAPARAAGVRAHDPDIPDILEIDRLFGVPL